MYGVQGKTHMVQDGLMYAALAVSLVTIAAGFSGIGMVVMEKFVKEDQSLTVFICMFLLLIGSYFMGYSFLTYRIMQLDNEAERGAGFFSLKQARNLLSLSFSGIVFSFLVKLSFWASYLLAEVLRMQKTPKTTIHGSFEFHNRIFKMIVEVLSIVFGMFALKKFFISYATYLLQWVEHRSRIINNRFLMNIIEKLEYSLELPPLPVEKKISQVFWKIAGDSPAITFANMSKHVGEEDATILFSLFDENVDSEISEDEFHQGYKRILEEREKINHTAKKKEEIIQNLDAILTMVCGICSFVAVFYFLDIDVIAGAGAPNAENKAERTPLIGMIFSLNAVMISTIAIYGKIFADLANSICYIFFVRPFDIGDMVKINGVVYTVQSFGLLNSLFKTGEKYVSIPNSNVIKESIENLSRSLFYHGSFSITIVSKRIQEDVQYLKECITSFVNENKKFKKTFYLGGFEGTKSQEVKADIQYILTCTYKDRELILEREDELKLFVYSKLHSLAGR